MNFAAPRWRESCYNSPQMIVQKAYKYRFFPTYTQARQLAQTFGSARFVWNLALELRTKSYEQEKKSISYTQTAAALTHWKKDGPTATAAGSRTSAWMPVCSSAFLTWDDLGYGDLAEGSGYYCSVLYAESYSSYNRKHSIEELRD